MLEGRVALVTGASRGIGRAIAERLGQDGATVIGTATTDQGAAAISERLSAAGITGAGMALDVTAPGAIEDLVSAVAKAHGPIGILVNNAGITRDGLLMRMGDADLEQVLDTNLLAVIRMTKACLRGMTKARWGRVINIGSIVGATGNPGQTNYAAAKAGLLGFGKSLAREVASRQITVNTVAPGFIETDMTAVLSDDQRQTMLQSVPLGRLGQAEEIAHAVAFLAAPHSGYITGETLHVNGGMYMA